MFWAGCLLLGVFAALSVMIYFSPDSGYQDENEVARLREAQLKMAPRAAPPSGDVSVASWPGWRGIRRDGHSLEKGLNLDWSEKTPPELWRIPIGDGFGSIAAVRNRVFTQFQDGSSEVVGCFDAKTGKDIWRHAYEARFEDRFGAGPRATPLVVGEQVFTVGATGILHCLGAAKGTVLWHKDMKQEFGVATPTWGFSFSPLVVDDLVLVVPGGKDGNAIAALDRATGAVRWKGFNVGGGYSAPLLATIVGQRQAIFFTGQELLSVVPETGKELWRFPWKTDYQANIATPIVFDNYVFISSGYNKGCALVRIDKADDGSLDVKRVYQHKRMANHFSSSIYYDGAIYGFNDANFLCLDATDPKGKAKWSERDFQRGNLLLVEGHLIILGENGRLAVAQATPTAYNEKGRIDLFPGPLVWSAPALADGLLFLRDRKEMVCLDLRQSK